MTFIKKFFNNNKELRKELIHHHRQKIKSFRAKMDAERKWTDKLADFLTESFGTVLFLGLNVLWFTGWIVINIGWIPGIPVFDPFPFGLLTMIVSLEAIGLAIIVLISQNREAHIADIREEIDLQINVRAEQEITKILIILDQIHDHLGLPAEDDAELMRMKQKTNLNLLEEELMQEMVGHP
jgi:uncharacterized membrane protein